MMKKKACNSSCLPTINKRKVELVSFFSSPIGGIDSLPTKAALPCTICSTQGHIFIFELTYSVLYMFNIVENYKHKLWAPKPDYPRVETT